MVLAKHDIEAALRDENREISAGRLKEDNPLDLSEDFRVLCEACRRGDLKVCQEKIQEGININARDRFDYTPLILVRPGDHPFLRPFTSYPQAIGETIAHRRCTG